MKLKPRIKGMKDVPKEEPKKRKSQENTLPPNEYKPMFSPIRFLVKDTPSMKDPTKTVKQYLELSVKRFDDDAAMPHVFVQMYQESEFYTGYLKGKSVHFPLEMLYDFMDNLKVLDEECEKNHIE